MLPNLQICKLCYQAGISKNLHCRIHNKCFQRKALNLTMEGVLKHSRWNDNPTFLLFMRQTRKSIKTSEEVIFLFQIPIDRIQRYLARHFIRSWTLETSNNKAVKQGRLAELFVKEQVEFSVIRDSWNRSSKEPFDLILKKYGAIDVKSSIIQHKRLKGYRYLPLFWSFSVGELSRSTKYVFLVGYDSGKPDVLALFIIPKSDLQGARTVQIFVNPLRGRYSQYLYKFYGRFSQTTICPQVSSSAI